MLGFQNWDSQAYLNWTWGQQFVRVLNCIVDWNCWTILELFSLQSLRPQVVLDFLHHYDSCCQSESNHSHGEYCSGSRTTQLRCLRLFMGESGWEWLVDLVAVWELLVTATLWSSVVFSMLSAPSGSWLPGSPLSELNPCCTPQAEIHSGHRSLSFWAFGSWKAQDVWNILELYRNLRLYDWMLLERSKNAVAKKCFITLDCRTDIKSLALLGDTKAYKAESAKWTGHETRIENGPKVSPFDSFTPWKAAGCCELGVSENSVPLNPMVLLIIIPIKWLFHWEYTLFSDKPISGGDE